jgi:uncharacterized membrane protein YkoI
MTQSKSSKVGGMIALVTSGVVAGGVLAGSLTANAADTPAPTYGSVTNPNPGDTSKPQRSDETLLTGDTAAKVKAAVLAKYPGATFVRVETDSDGAYEAHITKADGTPVTVEVSKAFAVTGEEAGGRGGPGRGGPHGAPVSAATLAKIKSAVTAKYPGATVNDAHADADGTYDAFVTKKDGTRVVVELDKAFAVTGEKAGRGPGGHGDRGAPPSGTTQSG